MLNTTVTLKNGVIMPVLGAGTWQIKNDEAYRVVKEALEAGYRLIDTANGYGNEEGVGRAIRESGIAREEIFVTSKLPAEIKGYDETMASFNSTMEKLGLDYLDLYLIHAPWPWEDMGGDYAEGNIASWKAMEELYNAGRIRAIGISNFQPNNIEPLLKNCTVVPHVNQISYYVGHIQRACTEYCLEKGILVESYAPLATGAVFKQELVHTLAAKNNVTAAQLCIRYCLQKGRVTIPKSTHKERLIENANLNFVIPAEDMAALDALDTEN